MVESTFERLTQSFVIADEDANKCDGEVFAGMVTYLDPGVDALPDGPGGTAPNVFPTILWKRKAYAYERELRAVFAPRSGSMVGEIVRQGALPGWGVPVNLDRLVERIVVGPGTPDWHFKVLRRFIPSAWEVRFSRLDDDPETGEAREAPDPNWVKFTHPVAYPPFPGM